MAAGYTSGTQQALYLKLEMISDTLLAATADFDDFAGAGKLIDGTSATTWAANRVGVVGDVIIGGDAVIDTWREWPLGRAKSHIIGEEISPVEFTLKANRRLTLAKALENAATSSPVWGAVLRTTTPAETVQSTLSGATIDAFYGTISTKLDLKGDSTSRGHGDHSHRRSARPIRQGLERLTDGIRS